MQQHIYFPMEISVIKFQAWPIWWKIVSEYENPLSKIAFRNDQNTFLVVKCLRIPFRSVGSGWQWISEGLNCVRFLFKFVTWKIGPLSHLNDFHMFLVTISVNFYFMHNPVFEHSDTLSFALLACVILHINGKQFRCSVFTFFSI